MTSQPHALVRPATASDADAIVTIYNHYIRETVVTFEVDELQPQDMLRRIQSVQWHEFPWLVADDGGEVVGYAYAAAWHARSAYRHSVETTVYLGPGQHGRGLGTRLYESLLELLPGRQVHTAIGGIALPNAASVALHEKLGFRKAAHYKEVGFKFGRWIDVGYWQRML